MFDLFELLTLIITDKVTGLRAFEEHLPYQKYQGPPIVVRYVCLEILLFPAKYKESSILTLYDATTSGYMILVVDFR